MTQPAYKQEPVPFAFSAAFIPSYFKTGMYLVEVEKAKLNVRSEPVLTFKVTDSPDGKMVNARRTENFFLNSESEKGAKLWEEKLTEVLTSLGLRTIADLAELVGQKLVMSFSKPGREELPNFRKATDFDKSWQPLSTRSQHTTKQPF